MSERLRNGAGDLEVEDLVVGYNGVAVVQGASLGVRSGEIVCILGPNGCGKSTLVKALTGNLSVLGGRVRLGTRDITGLSGDQLARMGVAYVPQLNDSFNTLSVEENLLIGGYLLGRNQRGKRVEEVFAMFPELREMRSRRAQNLSGGERKMLAMSRVLMRQPSVIVLDEPTAGLAPQMAQRILKEHVTRVAADGRSVVLVEQRVQEALKVSSRAYVLVEGKIVLSGCADELLAREDIAGVFLGASTG